MNKILILILFILLIASLFILVISVGKAERVECLKWQEQANDHPGYYLTGWQAEQCAHYNIIIEI